MVHAHLADAAAELLRQTGVDLSALPAVMDSDLSALPAVMNSDYLAPVLGVTPAALAQDRYRGRGIPFVKIGRRVRYLRADVCRYLIDHRSGGDQ